MTATESNEEIKIYVEAATAASDRGRLVLLVTITISVLAFSAFWNARQESWLNSRLHMARLADLACKHEWKVDSIPEIIDDDKQLIDQAHTYYADRHFDGCKHLADVVKSLQEIQTKEVNQVKVPFFGSQFDVNDLGMFAGFAFVVSLIWFRYSLAREYINLVLCFQAALQHTGNHSKKTFYNLLAMRQVMTIPPPLEEDPARSFRHAGSRTRRALRFLWQHVSILLYTLPFWVQFLIVKSDRQTFSLGRSVSPHNAQIVILTERAFLVAILILTFLCLHLAHRIDLKWEKAVKEFRAAMAKSQTHESSPAEARDSMAD